MTGIYIHDSAKAPYTELILAGVKLYETRNRDTLRKVVGERVAIVRTGRGKAQVVGFVTVGEPLVVEDRSSWDAMRDVTKVPAGDAYDFKGCKYLYLMIDPEPVAEPLTVVYTGNRVLCEVR